VAELSRAVRSGFEDYLDDARAARAALTGGADQPVLVFGHSICTATATR
jgi:alpha-beta hydrolase superfamily lysophospholipase